MLLAVGPESNPMEPSSPKVAACCVWAFQLESAFLQGAWLRVNTSDVHPRAYIRGAGKAVPETPHKRYLGLRRSRSLSDNSQNPVVAAITCSRTISWCFLWQHEMLRFDKLTAPSAVEGQLPMSDRLLAADAVLCVSPSSAEAVL